MPPQFHGTGIKSGKIVCHSLCSRHGVVKDCPTKLNDRFDIQGLLWAFMLTQGTRQVPQED